MAELKAPQGEAFLDGSAAITWWSWQPGISPRLALLIGLPLVFLALFFLTVGALDLVYGISDSYTSPVQVRGLVLGYSTNGFNHLPQITIRLDQPAVHPTSTPTVSVPVSPAMSKVIHPGDLVILDYSSRLHNLYALRDGTSRFDIPGSSAAGNLLGTILLFLLGCLLLPYPLYLTLGGWHDLQSEGEKITGQIVGLRSPPTRLRRSSLPGLTPRIGRSWYGVALDVSDAKPPFKPRIFRISEERFSSLRHYTFAEVIFSPHLHFVQSIKQVEQRSL
jgi:hypothetical protein